MNKFWKKWVVFTSCCLVFSGCNPKSDGLVLHKEGIVTEKGIDDTTEEPKADVLGVYLCGQVKQPGVYEVPVGARITDVIQCAGGVTGKASLEIINLAEYVEDGEKIIIPSKAQVKKQKKAASQSSTGQININLANASDFTSLPGIGESRANDIVRYRETNGGFKDISEIMNVAGIKEGIFNRIKDKITT